MENKITVSEILEVKSATDDRIEIYDLIKHIKELEQHVYTLSTIPNDIELKSHHYQYFGDNQYNRIASAWYKGIPVLLFRNTGRDGDGFKDCFVLDRDKYVELVGYLASLCTQALMKRDCSISYNLDAQFDSRCMFNFYPVR